MPKIAPCHAVLAVLGFCLLVTPAQAQLTRTFVSAANGNDANNCDRPTPCRTLQAAHDKTADQGEVSVLVPGGYGTLTITKSISIINDGVGEAGISVPANGIGVTVNAPADSYVSLHGLTILGAGVGGTGVSFTGGAGLTITNCVIRNHTKRAVMVRTPGPVSLSLSRTVIADNPNDGIYVLTQASGSVRASFKHVEIYNTGAAGLYLNSTGGGAITAALEDSVVANSRLYGVAVQALNDQPSTLTVVRSAVINNALGIVATGGSSVWLGQSTITGNTVSWQGAGSPGVQSFGDNYLAGNADGNPGPPVIAKK